MIAVPAPTVAALAACFRIPSDSLQPLGGGQESSDGIVYAFEHAAGPRVIKIVPFSQPEAQQTFEERLRFVHFLGEHGVSTVYPISMEDGALYATAGEGDQRFAAYIMPRASGSHPGREQFTADFHYLYGKTIGKLHRVTQQYPIWRSVVHPQTGRQLLGWEQECGGFYEWCKDPDVKQHWLALRTCLEQLPLERGLHGFIHNDPHTHNLFFDGKGITLIDFDVANCHWFAVDVTIAMQSLMFEVTGGIHRPCADPAPLHAFFEDFLRGYESENHLEQASLDQLDFFINYRSALIFTVSQDWLATQPEVKNTWVAHILQPDKIFN